jgi:hypothetical protein
MSIEAHFQHLHDNPPAPFNPAYRPEAAAELHAVCEAMEKEGFYDTHSREECQREITRRLASRT